MVSAQNKEILWILDLVREKQANCFKRLFASVDVVPKEKVICFGWESSIFKEAEKVIILAMNITTDLQKKKRNLSALVSTAKGAFSSSMVEEMHIP